MLRRFFEPFLIEDLPATDRRRDELCLDEVAAADVYIGLWGNEYGDEDAEGLSPTEREFNRATELGKQRLVYVKGADDKARHPKMLGLVRRAVRQGVRLRLDDTTVMMGSVHWALQRLLDSRGLLRNELFDAAVCADAMLEDMDEAQMRLFVRIARGGRGFPLDENVPVVDLLTHLKLLDQGRPTNAAVLLFAMHPQRYLLDSGVKCVDFQGETPEEWIPQCQVFKGNLFDLVEQAVDFVLSKIRLPVETRKAGPQVLAEYEIPKEVVTEAIVNAVAHRDYACKGSMQVSLYADRLEVSNPGALPAALTLADLRRPHGSFPANPLVAEVLYLARYIERTGSGIGNMIRRCRQAGLDEPVFTYSYGFAVSIRRKAPPGKVAGEATGEVAALLAACTGSMSRQELQSALGSPCEENFRLGHPMPALDTGVLEMTIRDKPKRRPQKYRLTAQGRALLDAARKP